jgi:hypothetical protein
MDSLQTDTPFLQEQVSGDDFFVEIPRRCPRLTAQELTNDDDRYTNTLMQVLS